MPDNNKQLKIFAISCDLDYQVHEGLAANYDKFVNRNLCNYSLKS